MNQDFVIYDATGRILRTGNCPKHAVHTQAQGGEFVLEASACCVNDAVDPVSKKLIKGGCTEKPDSPSMSPTPSGKLSTASQLDLLWQAMDAGTFPKAEPFYSAIKAQKDAA